MALRAAYWAMHRQTEAGLTRSGVTADQFVLLALLAQEDGITQQELVRRAASDANTVRAMLVRLEGRGLVAREQHPTDRRARRVTLTYRGRQVYDKLWEDSDPVRQSLLAALEPQEAQALVESLNRIVQAIVPAGTGASPCSGTPAASNEVQPSWKGERG